MDPIALHHAMLLQHHALKLQQDSGYANHAEDEEKEVYQEEKLGCSLAA